MKISPYYSDKIRVMSFISIVFSKDVQTGILVTGTLPDLESDICGMVCRVKKLGLKLLGIHDWSLIGLFLVNPFMMVVFAIGVGMLFRRLLPRVYSLCVGGR